MKRNEHLLRIEQRAMERAMLDRYRSIWLRPKTREKDIVQVIKKQKWRRAGHLARMKDNRKIKRITYWCPYDDKKVTRH